MKQLIGTAVLNYLRILAKLQLQKNNPLIIGITGSAGKSSTLNAVEAVLSPYLRLKVSHKANSESGLPANILGFEIKKYSAKDWLHVVFIAPYKLLTNWERYDTYVAEMGIDSPFEPKNMSYLLKIFRPQIGVFLNARPMHSLNFDSLVSEKDPAKYKAAVTHEIAKEKGKLITQLPVTGYAILNADDPEVIAFAEKTKARVLSVGKSKDATLKVTSVKSTLSGTAINFQYKHTDYRLQITKYLLPESFAYTLTTALATALACDIPIGKAITALEKNFAIPPSRSTLIEGINGSLILDSTYNASAQAMIDSLELLTVSKGRKLALLGDMRELGQVAEKEHLLVADHAAKMCDAVYLVGPQMKDYTLPFLQKKKIPVQWFENAGKATQHLKTVLKKNDMLLVKSSQNTLFLEIAVEQLMANPTDADTLLCRRGEYWDKQREPYLK